MLQNTNTINLEELRSACKEDEELRTNNRYQIFTEENLTEINSDIEFNFENSSLNINQMQIQKQNNYI
jgi:DNA-binding transcriptional regulator WhiA